MTTDVDLLPLPEKSEIDRHLPTGVRLYGYTADDMKTYARACVAHAAAAKDAEIDALRADLDDYMRIANTEATRAERLAKALQDLLDETTDRIDCSRSSAGTIVEVVEHVRELLHDQEEWK